MGAEKWVERKTPSREREGHHSQLPTSTTFLSSLLTTPQPQSLLLDSH